MLIQERPHRGLADAAGDTEELCSPPCNSAGAQGKGKSMVNVPIRVLSNEVTIHTANAVSEFFEICQAANPESGYVALPPWLQRKVTAVSRNMEQVTESQQGLLTELEKVGSRELEAPAFQRVIEDLSRVVSQCDAAVMDTYSAPEALVRLWKKNLDLVAERNSHIENYLESFRIALDETCSAVLADLATKAMAG